MTKTNKQFKAKTKRDINSVVSDNRTIRVTSTEVAYLVIQAAKCSNVFLAAYPVITEQLFTQSERVYSLFWRALVCVYEAKQTIPKDVNVTRDLLNLEFERLIAFDPQHLFFTEDIIEQILGPDGFLDAVVNTPADDSTEKEALTILVKFVDERTVLDPLRNALLSISDNDSVSNSVELIQALEKESAKLLGLNDNASHAAVSDNLDFIPKGAVTLSTGVAWLDEYMRGGHAKDEAYIILGGTASGKCFGKDTEVLMYDGSIKKIQDIKVGDKVMGDDSTPRKVLKLHSGIDDMYEIIPNKGESHIVNSTHIMCLKTSSNRYRGKDNLYVGKNDYYARKYKIGESRFDIPLDEYISKCTSKFKHLSKLYKASVEFIEKKVPIDPYVLGCWLGDGTSSRPDITTMDKEIEDCWIEFANSRSLKIREHVKVNNKAKTVAITSKKIGGIGNTKNSFLNDLRSMNLINNKHIPDCYLHNSRDTRLELLAGLVDTDGHYNKSDIDIIQKNKTLADNIVYLARSLGLAAYIKECTKSCQTGAVGIYYRVCISGDTTVIPNRLKRKRPSIRKMNKDVLVVGFDVAAMGKGAYYGFETDGNHRFLLADFTVVHNSSIGVQIAVEGARKQLSIATNLSDAGYWYYFTYELTKEQLQERVYAYGAKVSRDTLDVQDGGEIKLSSINNLKNYEYEPFVNPNPNNRLGEKERLAAFTRTMGGDNNRLIIVDYSYPRGDVGTGGLDEVVRVLKREILMGKRIAGVIIDYAGIMISRHIGHNNLPPHAEFSLLNGFMDAARGRISIAFHCPTWVLHQLHGESSKFAPGVAIHHKDAKGARNIADNSDFAFCIGNRDMKSNLLTVSNTKHRRAKGLDIPKIVRYDGRFSAFLRPDKEYVIDPFTKQIIDKSAMAKLAFQDEDEEGQNNKYTGFADGV